LDDITMLRAPSHWYVPTYILVAIRRFVVMYVGVLFMSF
jgi:hypothetical protein